MNTAKKIKSPEKEIRFTRAAQGCLFFVFSAFFISLSAAIVVLATQGTEFEAPLLEGWLWSALLPLSISICLIKLAAHCIRHAYLILTPIGIEIFPLFRPEKHMSLIMWAEVHFAEISHDQSRLTLHYNAEKTSGVVMSLSPIMKAQRILLNHAIDGLMKKRSSFFL
jgi:hypothetical protein